MTTTNIFSRDLGESVTLDAGDLASAILVAPASSRTTTKAGE